jgi:hypothetical protein
MASRPGKMPTTSVRRRSSRLSRSGVGAPDLAPDLAGHGGEGEQVVTRLGQVRGGSGELAVQGCDDAVGLGGRLGGVGLVEDGPYQRGDPGLGGRLSSRRHAGPVQDLCTTSVDANDR